MNDLPISLLIFTISSGIGAGLIIFYTVIKLSYPNIFENQNVDSHGGSVFKTISTKVYLISIILLGIGLIASAAHLGHAFRFLNAFANPNSMISEEAYWSIAFGVLLLIILVRTLRKKEPPKILLVLTSVTGLGLLIVTSLVYTKSLGIPAWNHGVTPILFVFSAILMGSVVLLFLLMFQAEDNEKIKIMIRILIYLLFFQVLIEIAFSLQLNFGIKGIELPNLLFLSISRWVIGLLLPLIVAVATIKKSLKLQTGITLLFLTIIIGEGISRVIFFMNGVHI